MKALIEPSGRIAQVATEAFPVAPPLKWVECDETIIPDHHTYIDGQFGEPGPHQTAKTLAPADLAALLVAKGVISQEDVDGAKM